jgi:hypothetical protein
VRYVVHLERLTAWQRLRAAWFIVFAGGFEFDGRAEDVP